MGGGRVKKKDRKGGRGGTRGKGRSQLKSLDKDCLDRDYKQIKECLTLRCQTFLMSIP